MNGKNYPANTYQDLNREQILNKKRVSAKRQNIITTTCSYDCGGHCLLEVDVRDNKIIKIKSKKAEGLNISACSRGLTQKNVLYSPDRIKTPLKRIGDRGNGSFKAISWDEALETISRKFKQVIKEYGTESIYFIPGSGIRPLIDITTTMW